MTNIIEKFEQNQIAKLRSVSVITNFNVGDTVKVSIKIQEGATSRNQIYQGVVIAKRNRGISSSFVVRKISHEEGVERRFMIYSPLIQSIELVRRGIVRRAKLYYLRNRSGKSARIKERLNIAKNN